MAIRIRSGEKRSALAERCGISYKHLYGIENGYEVNSPSIEVLNRLANALQVPLSEVMDDAPKDEPKRQPNPTSHPEPKRPEVPPHPRRDRTREAGAA